MLITWSVLPASQRISDHGILGDVGRLASDCLKFFVEVSVFRLSRVGTGPQLEL